MSSQSMWQTTRDLTRRFIESEDGQDLIEYSVLAGLIALVVAGVVGTLGTSIRAALWDPLNVPF